MKSIASVTLALLLLCTGHALAEEKDPYALYSKEAKEYSQALNRELETNAASAYSLPPVRSDVDTTRVDKLMVLNFRDSPLPHLLEFYADISGMKTEVDEGVSARINFHSERRLTTDETLRVIGKLLKDQRINLSQTGIDSVRVHWAQE